MFTKTLFTTSVFVLAVASPGFSQSQNPEPPSGPGPAAEAAPKASDFNLRLPGERRGAPAAAGPFNLRLPSQIVPRGSMQAGLPGGVSPALARPAPDPEDDPDAIIRLPEN
jgi:hypothetical protein